MVDSAIIRSRPPEILFPVIPEVLAAPPDNVAPHQKSVGFEAGGEHDYVGRIGDGGVGRGGHDLVAFDADLGGGDVDQVDFGIVEAAEVTRVHDTALGISVRPTNIPQIEQPQLLTLHPISKSGIKSS